LTEQRFERFGRHLAERCSRQLDQPLQEDLTASPMQSRGQHPAELLVEQFRQ
jgi:hypothetical protein